MNNTVKKDSNSIKIMSIVALIGALPFILLCAVDFNYTFQHNEYLGYAELVPDGLRIVSPFESIFGIITWIIVITIIVPIILLIYRGFKSKKSKVNKTLLIILSTFAATNILIVLFHVGYLIMWYGIGGFALLLPAFFFTLTFVALFIASIILIKQKKSYKKTVITALLFNITARFALWAIHIYGFGKQYVFIEALEVYHFEAAYIGVPLIALLEAVLTNVAVIVYVNKNIEKKEVFSFEKELNLINDLLDNGQITEEEYAARRAEIIANL